MEWRGFNLFRNGLFAGIYSRHRSLGLFDVGGNKAYLFKAPFLGAAKLKVYLYDTENPEKTLGEAIEMARNRNVAMLEIYTDKTLDDFLPESIQAEKEKVATFVVDTSRDEKALWEGMSTSCRRGVKKAKNAGITIKATKNMDDFNEWWRIYRKTGRRGTFRIQNKALLLELFKTPALSRLLVAKVDGTVAAGLFIVTHEYPIYWLGASAAEYWKYFPNNLLHWEAIQWSAREGYPMYDFGGAGPYKTGVDEFKRKFGGDYVENNFYTLIFDAKRAKWVKKINILRCKLRR